MLHTGNSPVLLAVEWVESLVCSYCGHWRAVKKNDAPVRNKVGAEAGLRSTYCWYMQPEALGQGLHNGQKAETSQVSINR